MSSRLIGYFAAVVIGACSLSEGLSAGKVTYLQFEEMGMFAAASDGSGFSPILLQPGLNPAPSPDGETIAFGDGGHDGPGVSVVGWDGAGERWVGATDGFPIALSWSPDGTRIAFISSDQTGQLTLSVLNADGSGPTALAPLGETYPAAPAWSPDGARIFFSNEPAGE